MVEFGAAILIVGAIGIPIVAALAPRVYLWRIERRMERESGPFRGGP